MTFEALEYFVAIARGATYMNVAEEFNLSQSALSKIIRKMENELGIQLFDRTGRAVRVTEAGKQLLDDYARMEPYYKAMKLHMRQLSSKYQIKTVLGLPSKLLHLENHIHHFQEEYPQISLELIMPKHNRVKYAADAARSKDVDVVIMHKTAEYHGNSYVTLLKNDPLLVFMSQKHRLAAKKEVTPEDISRENIIVNNWGMEKLYGISREFQVLFPNAREDDSMTREDLLWNVIAEKGITIMYQTDVMHVDTTRVAVRPLSGLQNVPIIMITRLDSPVKQSIIVFQKYLQKMISLELN